MPYSRCLVTILLIAWCAPAGAASPSENSFKKEGFKRLNGGQIPQAFAGKRFTDEVHMADDYKPDGSMQGMSMGKKHINKWAISKDQLCVTDNFGEICYAVWKKGTAVRLVVGDIERVNSRRWDTKR